MYGTSGPAIMLLLSMFGSLLPILVLH